MFDRYRSPYFGRHRLYMYEAMQEIFRGTGFTDSQARAALGGT